MKKYIFLILILGLELIGCGQTKSANRGNKYLYYIYSHDKTALSGKFADEIKSALDKKG